MEGQRFIPRRVASQEDVDALVERLRDFEARGVVWERALEAVIEDIDSILEALTAEDDEAAQMVHAEQQRQDAIYSEALSVLAAEETPEEEAARLRREAIEQFEASNEDAPAAVDFNDVTDVPPEGRPVG